MGRIAPLPVTKICSACHAEKPISDFTVLRSEKNRGEIVSACKKCCAARAKQLRNNDPSFYRRCNWAAKLKRAYGLTPAEYYEILAQQNGGCAICGSRTPGGMTMKRNDPIFAVDHCHATGKVRGLLCDKCNHALGLINDNSTIAMNMAKYLMSVSC